MKNLKAIIKSAKDIISKSSLPQPSEVLFAPYVFVLSTGRCGTKLLSLILEESSQLAVFHNPKPALEYVSSLVHKNKSSAESLELAILAARFDFFVESFRNQKIYVEANNRVTFFASSLAKLLPNSKFIHLVRHPAEFVRSGMRRGYYSASAVQHQRLCPRDNQEWKCMNRLEKIAWEWNEISLSIEGFKDNLGDRDRVITILSNDLFTDPSTTHGMFKSLCLRNPYSSKSGKQKLDELLRTKVNAQTTGEYPHFIDWPDEEKDSLNRIATLAPIYNF